MHHLIRLAVATAIGVVALWACAPMFEFAVFFLRTRPDEPRGSFLDGQLGILYAGGPNLSGRSWPERWKGFRAPYLVVSYRYLTGVGLNAAEKAHLRQEMPHGGFSTEDWFSRWMDAAEKVHPPDKSKVVEGALAPLMVRKFDAGTNTFLANCGSDAFRTALNTLEDRSRRHGRANAWVREWVEGQRTVFQMCADDGAERLPDAPANAPAWYRRDREYQLAAFSFYRFDHEDAIRRFGAIARDPNSPWRDISRYLVIRTKLRQATADKDIPPTHPVIAEARRLLADPSAHPIHSMTRHLLERMCMHAGEPKFFKEVADGLIQPNRPDNLREELYAFTRMESRVEIRGGHPLTDWIACLREPTPARRAGMLRRWRANHQPAFLIAALHSSKGNEPDLEELFTAARELPADSPGFATAFYHLGRLQLVRRETDRARADIDTALAARLPLSSRNRFLELRMSAATSFPEMLKLAPRRAVQILDDTTYEETPAGWWKQPPPAPTKTAVTLYDSDSTAVFNRQLPLTLWREAIESDLVLPAKRRDFALAALTRAALLKDHAMMSDMAARLQSFGRQPDPRLAAISTEHDPLRRRFAVVYYLLYQPEASPLVISNLDRPERPGAIENFGWNWWCLGAQETNYHSRPEPESPAVLPFLSEEDRARGLREADSLYKATGRSSDAGVFFADTVLEFARTHRKDPRLAEAFWRTRRTARFGHCRSNEQDAKMHRVLVLAERMFPGTQALKLARHYGPW